MERRRNPLRYLYALLSEFLLSDVKSEISPGVSISCKVFARLYAMFEAVRFSDVEERTLEFPHDETLKASGINLFIPISQ